MSDKTAARLVHNDDGTVSLTNLSVTEHAVLLLALQYLEPSNPTTAAAKLAIYETLKTRMPLRYSIPWIEWEGGSRPLLKGKWVEVMLRNGQILAGIADTFEWEHANYASDVVRYRAT